MILTITERIVSMICRGLEAYDLTVLHDKGNPFEEADVA
jgi:hypothetical protein